jgi:tRNA nucleotidyltransferase (CCA-adding enzyme)
MTVLDNTKASLNVRLAALFHDIAKPACLTVDEDGEGHCYGHAAKGSQMAEAVLTRLNFDHKTVAAVGAIIKEHMNNYDNISELSIKRLIRRVGPANIDDLFDLQLADIKGSGLSGRDSHWIELVRNRCWEVMSRREPLTTHDLNISGYDLMFLYDTNREMGEALEYLLDRVIDNPALNEKETLLALLKQRS